MRRETIRTFFTNLLAVCNMQPAAKPVQAKQCEFCGGVKCFGACGAESAFGAARNVNGQPVPGDGKESAFARNGGKPPHGRRDTTGE